MTIETTLFVLRSDEDIDLTVSADVQRIDGRVCVGEVKSPVPLTGDEVDDACAKLADIFRMY